MKNKIKVFLSTVSVSLMAAPAIVAAAGFSAPTGTGLPEAQGGIIGIITGIMNWLLMLVGILGVIGFAIAGILYLTSAGDEGRAGTAKQAMLNSIIGVIVALLGLIVIKAAETMLKGGESATF